MQGCFFFKFYFLHANHWYITEKHNFKTKIYAKFDFNRLWWGCVMWKADTPEVHYRCVTKFNQPQQVTIHHARQHITSFRDGMRGCICRCATMGWYGSFTWGALDGRFSFSFQFSVSSASVKEPQNQYMQVLIWTFSLVKSTDSQLQLYTQ